MLPLPTNIDRPPVVCIVGFSNSGKTTVTAYLAKTTGVTGTLVRRSKRLM